MPSGPLSVSISQAHEYFDLIMGDHEAAPESKGSCSTPEASADESP